MSWKIKDVDKFKKGLDDKDKDKWVTIANTVLAQCIKDKGKDKILDCEVKAIRTANARIDNKDESELSNYVMSKNIIFDKTQKININLSIVSDDEYQTAFPIGLFNTSKYGEVIITKTFAKKAVENWKRLKENNRNIWMDTKHDFGAANAWAEDVVFDDDGIKIKWDFTPKGKKFIDDKEYKYYSAALMMDTDIETGKEMYPVLEAVSLTNSPVMYTMPSAHLDKGKNTQSDVDINNSSTEENMTIAEILKQKFDTSELSEDQKKQLVEKFGIEIAKKDDTKKDDDSKKDDKVKKELSKENETLKDEKETLADVNKTLSDRLSKIEKANHEKEKVEIIEAALKDGKIDPKDRETWEKRFDKQSEFTKDIIKSLPKLHDFTEIGNGGNAPTGMQGNDAEYAKALGISEEDYKNYSNSGKPVKKKKEDKE